MAEGKQVSLKPLDADRLDLLVKWRSREEAQRHQPISELSREQLLQFIKSRSDGELNMLLDHDYILIIEDTPLSLAIGWMTMEVTSRVHGLVRIGYTVDKEYWNQGYATAAVRELCRFLFSETTVERVEADCSVHNPASQRVLEKCGFRRVGLKRQYLIIRGQRIDHYYYETIKVDFLNA